MMAYLELFEHVADHVTQLGVKVEFKRGRHLSASAIKRAQSKSLIPIPDSLADFYSEIGNGMSFRWIVERDEDREPFANYECSRIGDKVLKSIDQISWRTEWDNSYDFRYTDDPELAKRTALRMRKWMPIHDEGNGARFCIDTGAEGDPVVFDQLSWTDGGTGENGHVLGESLLDFFAAWSNPQPLVAGPFQRRRRRKMGKRRVPGAVSPAGMNEPLHARMHTRATVLISTRRDDKSWIRPINAASLVRLTRHLIGCARVFGTEEDSTER